MNRIGGYRGRAPQVLLFAFLLALIASGCSDRTVSGIEISRAPAGSVNIYRDVYGVPHLYAEREEDGFWGHGYTAAEDHLEGLLAYYLSVRGELAGAFGPGSVDLKGIGVGDTPLPLGIIPDTVASDMAARQWLHLEDARANFPTLPEQLQRNMTAYIAGVEQYMADHPERVPDWAPDLEPALPLAAASGIMLIDSMQACGGAVARAQAQAAPATMEGSNVWAFPAERMKENAAVFLSDSHGVIQWPFGTFLVPTRINAGAMDGWLLDAPGMVLIIKGHSRHHAWGWAEGPRRPADCVVVETLDDDPAAYLYDGKRVAMHVVPYEIKVKGAAPVRGTFEYTHHNQVLSPVVHRQATTAWAVSSAYMHRAGFATRQFREMLLATDHKSMREAMAAIEIYPANLVYAGSDGSINYIRPGRIPVRSDGADGTGAVDGNSSAAQWRGIHPLEDLVQVRNPSQKYLVNNNVSPETMFRDPYFRADDYPPDFAFDGRIGTRQKRAIDLFEGDSMFSFEDAQAFVRDVFVMGSDKWGGAFEGAVQSHPAVPDGKDSKFSNFLDVLIAFDGHFLPDSRGALFHALVREGMRKEDPATAAAIESAIHQDQPLTDQQQEVLLSEAFDAYQQVRDNLGGLDREFGDVFRIGRGDASAPARGLSLYPLAGDPANTLAIPLWSAAYTPPDDKGFRWVVGGTRHPFLVQFTQPVRSYSLAVFGASDNPESPHYSDRSVRVGAGDLHSNFFEPAELAAAVSTERLAKTGLD